MGPVALVTNEIEDASKLIEHLIREGLKIKAAAWIKREDDFEWQLFLALPGLKNNGPLEYFKRIIATLQQMPQPFLIESGDIKLIDVKDPLALAVAEYERKYAGRGLLRYKGDRLGSVYIEGAYIYPATTAAPSSPD